MLKEYPKDKLLSNQSGAAIVETTLVFLFLFATIFFLLQLAYTYYCYSAMRYSVTRTVNHLAVDTGDALDGENLKNLAKSEIEDLLKNSLGVDTSNLIIRADACRPPGGGCQLGIKVSYPFQLFGTQLFGVNKIISASRSQEISDDCFACEDC